MAAKNESKVVYRPPSGPDITNEVDTWACEFRDVLPGSGLRLPELRLGKPMLQPFPHFGIVARSKDSAAEILDFSIWFFAVSTNVSVKPFFVASDLTNNQERLTVPLEKMNELLK